MKVTLRMLFGLAIGLLLVRTSDGQEACRPGLFPSDRTGCCVKEAGWTQRCFPRSGCADDYCRRPLPRQCWPCYPTFYRCVPAGECACQTCGNRREGVTWCIFPTCKAFTEAVWWR